MDVEGSAERGIGMIASRRNIGRYLLAVASCVAALWLTCAIPALRESKHTLMFLGAVTFSAWIGGWRTGLVAIGLSAFLYLYKVLPPFNTPLLSDPYDLLRLGLFLAVAIMLNGLQGARDSAERMLRSSQHRLDLALDAARVGAWELTVGTGEFWHSSGLCDLYGRRADRFAYTYEAFLGYIVPADRDEVVRALTHVIEVGGMCQVEHRITGADKSIRRIITRCKAHVDEKGKIDRLVGAAMEVAEPVGRIGRSEETSSARDRQRAIAV
jgi:PAS domain-containing protein